MLWFTVLLHFNFNPVDVANYNSNFGLQLAEDEIQITMHALSGET